MIKLIIFLYLTPTTQNVETWCDFYEVHHSEIVVRQFVLETGWGKSYNCRVRNNLFGLVKPKGGYFIFNHWSESIQAYKTKVQYKWKEGEEYYNFLDRIGYASAKNYIKTLKQIKLK